MHRICALLSSCGGTSWLPGALPAQPLSPAGSGPASAPVRWRYRLYNHVCRGEGGEKNNDNRNDPLIVRNAGSQPRGGPGGSGARRRDAPFPQGVPGLARSPAAAAGAWPSEPLEQSREQVGERGPGGAVLPTGRTSSQERRGGAGRFPTGELG